MLLFNKLKKFEDFSDTEHKIAEFVLKNPMKVTNMSIQDLAKHTYSSASSISRFCQKLEMDGFSEFKIKIANEMGGIRSQNKRIEDDLPFSAQEGLTEIMQSIFDLNLQSLNDTYKHLDFEQLQRIALKIEKTPHLYLYGTGQSLVLAQDFQYKLYRIFKNCHLETQVGFQNLKASAQGEDSMTLMISYYGHGINNLRIIKRLHEKGVPIVLITGPDDNPLCQYADEVIHIPAQEQLMEKMASFSSRTAIQLVLDLIYALIFSLNYDYNQSIVQGLIW